MKPVFDPRVILLCGCLAACAGEPPPSSTPPTPAAPVLQRLDTPAAPGSGEPGLSLGPDGSVHLTWVEPTGDGHQLRRAVLGGAGWGKPTTIASGADWFVNWADTPSMSVGADGKYLAHWLAKSGEGTYAYHVMVSTSADGATWSKPQRLHEDDSATEHGFVTLLPKPASGWRAVWLDGAAMVGDGPMALHTREVESDGTLGPETALDDRTCDCCPTTAAALPDGVIVGWRDRSEAEIRDIAVARLVAGAWEAPRIVAADHWKMPGCPVNGPAVDTSGDDVVLAWFTEEAEKPRVQVALSRDRGQTFPVRAVLSEAAVGRVDVIALPDGAVVTWVESVGDAAALVFARVDKNGARGPTTTLVELSPGRRTGMPRAVVADGRLVVAWTHVGEATQVMTATYGL
jgi:hypothetical protein